MQRTRPVPGDAAGDDLVDAVMAASRALLAIVVRSLASVDHDVTLPQYRVLVVLGQRGTRRPADLAAVLGVSPSTATRMCDRLVAKGLVDRDRLADDRREVTLGLSDRGRALVDDVTTRRRAELSDLLAALPNERQEAVAAALHTLADAAGEVREREWAVAP